MAWIPRAFQRVLLAIFVLLLSSHPLHSSSIDEDNQEASSVLRRHSEALERILSVLSEQGQMMPTLMASMIQSQAQQLASIQNVLEEQTRFIHEALGVHYSRLQETLRNITCEVSENIHNNDIGKAGCVKDNGEVVSHGDTYTYGCDIIRCENGRHHPIGRPASVPTGFRTVSDGCYLPLYHLGHRSWEGARSHCLGLGSDIAKPASDFETFRQFLMDINRNAWWLGGRKEKGLFFYVIDGTPVDHRLWKRGYPQGDGNCLLFSPPENRPFYSYDCRGDLHFVCQWPEREMEAWGRTTTATPSDRYSTQKQIPHPSDAMEYI